MKYIHVNRTLLYRERTANCPQFPVHGLSNDFRVTFPDFRVESEVWRRRRRITFCVYGLVAYRPWSVATITIFMTPHHCLSIVTLAAEKYWCASRCNSPWSTRLCMVGDFMHWTRGAVTFSSKPDYFWNVAENQGGASESPWRHTESLFPAESSAGLVLGGQNKWQLNETMAPSPWVI
jgi:hypothetical protein